MLFLAEAFTRPAMMHELARIGFTQSYTYFTWRTGKSELQEYALELVDAADYMRPNFFVNTPDILHASLQYGGPPMFKIRAVLAALLSPTYGVYAGYELYEHVAVKPGSEEYPNSEKYALRPRDWSHARAHARAVPHDAQPGPPRAPGDCSGCAHLTSTTSTRPTSCAGASRTTLDDGTDDTVLVVVNLDPHGARETTVHLDMPALGLDWDSRFDGARRGDRRRPTSGERTTTCDSTRSPSPRTS